MSSPTSLALLERIRKSVRPISQCVIFQKSFWKLNHILALSFFHTIKPTRCLLFNFNSKSIREFPAFFLKIYKPKKPFQKKRQNQKIFHFVVFFSNSHKIILQRENFSLIKQKAPGKRELPILLSFFCFERHILPSPEFIL